MKCKLTIKRFFACILLSPLFCIAVQAQNQAENSDDDKILKDWKTLIFQRNPLPGRIDLPKRKFNSPFFCNELLPYRNGFIINSITSNRSGRNIDITTSFYYFDLTTSSLSELVLPGVDTIESLVVLKDDLYCSLAGKTGRSVVHFTSKGREVFTANDALKKAKWLKLGCRNDTLFALTPEGLHQYANSSWRQLLTYSLDRFYTEELKFRYSCSSLPTTNLKISESYVWFLQEIVQERESELFRLDINSGKVSEFFHQVGYTDNYAKQVNDYLVLPDDAVLVTASRLLGSYLVLKASASVNEVLIFGNAINTSERKIGPFEVTACTMKADTVYFAARNGLFALHTNTIRALMIWKNQEQLIKEDGFDLHFQFVPRSLAVLPGGKFLMGGMWGGLFVLDPAKGTTVCVDDIDSDKVKKMTLEELVQGGL